MMELLTWLVGALATWRITSFIVYDDGPFDIMGKIRDRMGVTYSPYGVREAATELGKLLICPFCASVWVGLTLAALQSAENIILVALSYSAVTGIIESVR